MHPRFQAVIETLSDKLDVLLACAPRKFGALPIGMPASGVYLFSEGDRNLYVGRSNRLRKRYFLHCRPGSRHNQASFAYRLARETLQITDASYAGANTRAGLAATEAFNLAFSEAKARIRDMDYRYVEEVDQPRQAILEAYCAIVLSTPYNDFDTHWEIISTGSLELMIAPAPGAICSSTESSNDSKIAFKQTAGAGDPLPSDHLL